MSLTRYKGFKIMARPYQLFDSKRWISDLEIRRDGRRREFSIDDRYPTRRDAEAGSSKTGRQIIDGSISGWSVEHLRNESRGGPPSHSAWKGVPMRAFIIAGVVILGLGAFVLLRGASFTSERNVLKVGDVQITADQRQTVPPWAGVAALVVGAGLIVTGVRKRA